MIWSDESFFIMFPKDKRMPMYRTPNEACMPECPAPVTRETVGASIITQPACTPGMHSPGPLTRQGQW